MDKQSKRVNTSFEKVDASFEIVDTHIEQDYRMTCGALIAVSFGLATMMAKGCTGLNPSSSARFLSVWQKSKIQAIISLVKGLKNVSRSIHTQNTGKQVHLPIFESLQNCLDSVNQDEDTFLLTSHGKSFSSSSSFGN